MPRPVISAIALASVLALGRSAMIGRGTATAAVAVQAVTEQPAPPLPAWFAVIGCDPTGQCTGRQGHHPGRAWLGPNGTETLFP
jgi:hypothetical protein